MLKAEQLNNDTAPTAWVAARDAQMRNAVGITHFSAQEQRKANAMLFALQLCYRAKASYINWRYGGAAARPKFAAIKFEAATVTDRKNLSLLEDDWKKDPMIKSLTKRVTPQGILYRAYF